MVKILRPAMLLAMLAGAALCGHAPAFGQAIHACVPVVVDPAAKYLIFVHGKILETQGVLRPYSERHGYYEFEQIAEAWRAKGFEVIAEARLKDVDVGEYARVVAARVDSLLQGGVPPERITVVGASKGGVIVEHVSSLLCNPRINYALLSSGYEVAFDQLQAAGRHLWGNVLSLYDPTDETGAGSCRRFFDAARDQGLRRTREIEVKLGLGHGILYRPYPEVIAAVAAWADEAIAEEEIQQVRLDERVLVLMRGPWNDTMTVLDAGPSLVVVDAWSTPQSARRGRALAERLFGKPVSHVINTHHHWDHTFGNQAFADATIVGHTLCAEDMRAAYGTAAGLAVQQARLRSEGDSDGVRLYMRDTAWAVDAGFTLTPPTRLVGDRDRLKVGDLTLCFRRAPGLHTRNDLMVAVPELGLLFGRWELLSPDRITIADPADRRTLRSALADLRASMKTIRYLVPGHGRPTPDPDLGPAAARLADLVRVQPAPLVFATCIEDSVQERQAAVLVDSIRRFGGRRARAPVYVVVKEPQHLPCPNLKDRDVRLLALAAAPGVADYPFATKVLAAAQVEALLGVGTHTMVWMDPTTLLLGPPGPLELDGRAAVGLRPVHIRNVGLPVEAPVDPFWERVYAETGVDPRTIPAMRPVVDPEPIRFYANCGIIAYRPALGLCRKWADLFTRLVGDPAYQQAVCADPAHRIFLHQAVLSGVILAGTTPAQRRWLPLEAGYPLHLHARVPARQQIRRLSRARAVFLENVWEQDPDWMNAFQVDRALGAWLAEARRRLRP